MNTQNLAAILQADYDCLILVHPQIHVLEATGFQAQMLNFSSLNVSKGLSQALLPVSSTDRSQFSQQWFINKLRSYAPGPMVCIHIDLLFEPSLQIDPLTLFRQTAKITRIIVLWPGQYSENILSYATPEHHHYRSWRISKSLVQQPALVIQQLLPNQGV